MRMYLGVWLNKKKEWWGDLMLKMTLGHRMVVMANLFKLALVWFTQSLYSILNWFLCIVKVVVQFHLKEVWTLLRSVTHVQRAVLAVEWGLVLLYFIETALPSRHQCCICMNPSYHRWFPQSISGPHAQYESAFHQKLEPKGERIERKERWVMHLDHLSPSK